MGAVIVHGCPDCAPGMPCSRCNTPSRYEDCIRWHSKTCTCGITEADCTTGQSVQSLPENLDAIASGNPPSVSAVSGARAFWALKDLEHAHEALRADVLTVASDPHLEPHAARVLLMAALTGQSTRTPVSLELVDDLVVALRSLAYAAMTSGGTAGPDVALKDAIRWATEALEVYDRRATQRERETRA